MKMNYDEMMGKFSEMLMELCEEYFEEVWDDEIRDEMLSMVKKYSELRCSFFGIKDRSDVDEIKEDEEFSVMEERMYKKWKELFGSSKN